MGNKQDRCLHSVEYCVASGGNILDVYGTVGANSSHGIKRQLLFGRKVMTNLDSVLKSRTITLSTKVHIELWFF